MRRLLFIFLAAAIALFSSLASAEEKKKPIFDTRPVNYIAIGDSYSIGEGASFWESWPIRLAIHLRQTGIYIQSQKVLAKTGWATSDAIAFALPVFQASKPQFATLMIGVNDWVRGISAQDFRKRLKILLDGMLKVLPRKENLLVIDIPDFSVTPTGKEYAQGRDISAGIQEFNKVIREEAEKRELTVVDIFQVSQAMSSSRSLIADDGLHPSAKTYAFWEQWIFPYALKIFKPGAK